MKNWMNDMLSISENSTCKKEVFRQIEGAAKDLGFENFAYGLQLPLPVTCPKVFVVNNYPVAWQNRYVSENYILVDPTIKHCRQSLKPLVWTEEVFTSTPVMWDEAQSFGICVGWSQSCFGPMGTSGMLTLSRSRNQLDAMELIHKEQKMRWLVNVTHLSMSRVLPQPPDYAAPSLSAREIEVLKWTADGKSAYDIGEILALSKATIDFHVKNAIAKLQVSNKTAATVRAAMLGILG